MSKEVKMYIIVRTDLIKSDQELEELLKIEGNLEKLLDLGYIKTA
jgi:hypothetical protein